MTGVGTVSADDGQV